jgi:hypothetical protein
MAAIVSQVSRLGAEPHGQLGALKDLEVDFWLDILLFSFTPEHSVNVPDGTRVTRP